ncbi:MAG: hypothetical protein ACXWPM_00070 [Bdellovibrionota bacterium]
MAKAMPIIDETGKYVYLPNTRILATSSRPVYRARIEVALPQGDWIGAPTSGHQLIRFKRVRESQHQIEEFQKALELYLNKYNPDVIDTLVTRGGVTMDLNIAEGVLNAVV